MRVIMRRPDSPGREQLADSIVRCIDRNGLRQGLALCRELNERHPDYAYGWYLASFLMKKARHYADALRAIDRALQISAADKYQLHRFKCLYEMGDIAAARDAAGGLGGRDFDDAPLHSELGTLLLRAGDHAVAALDQYDRAVRL
ncbi:MAG: hypothetical protein HC807_02175, partial [Gammaproteobacteria bacterium]|nr:hypothetical protein [Gammaproteobacteria bacterium]